jgi:magnesium chelatase accessory protein
MWCDTRDQFMFKKPDWSTEGADWPHRDVSQFVQAAGLNWHVQRMGSGPMLVLLHGTGAATHSWHKIMPMLAQSCSVIAMDLPGHGFTQTPTGLFGHRDLSLAGMARLVQELLATLRIAPRAFIGHSAGAALGAEMILSGQIKAPHLIALNGAFAAFEGLAAHVFPPLAKVIALNPLTIFALATAARDPKRVAALLAGTGSSIDAVSQELYGRLFASSGHVSAVMAMMANWELDKLVPRLPLLNAKTSLLAGLGDTTVPPSVSRDAAHIIANARLIEIAKLGHLMHEESPEQIAEIILAELG